MPYFVLTAADCGGVKVNLRLRFETGRPSVHELVTKATTAFSNVLVRRGVHRDFEVNAVVMYNEAKGTWDMLAHAAQLTDGAQVYLFQTGLRDVPGEIPEAEDGEVHADTTTGSSVSALLNERLRGADVHRGDDGAARSITTAATTTSVEDGQRTRSALREGVASPRSPAPRTPRSGPPHITRSAVSPEARGASYGGSRAESSILREERAKIEWEMQLPLDALRAQLRRETSELERSLSRH